MMGMHTWPTMGDGIMNREMVLERFSLDVYVPAVTAALRSAIKTV